MTTQAIPIPYYRIVRPHLNQPYPNHKYLEDARYAPDQRDLVRGYHYLEHDLLEVFEFVEPADDNLKCFSHKLYGLLLRASTEFETNAKAILEANGYPQSRGWNICDYYKIEQATRLSEYSVTISQWNGVRSTFHPFAEWRQSHTLSWYQAYNDVKHNRASKFPLATLEVTCQAICAVFAIVFSQFQIHAFSPLRAVTFYQGENGRFLHPNCLMEIQTPTSWAITEMYDFDWPSIENSATPFQQFTF